MLQSFSLQHQYPLYYTMINLDTVYFILSPPLLETISDEKGRDLLTRSHPYLESKLLLPLRLKAVFKFKYLSPSTDIQWFIMKTSRRMVVAVLCEKTPPSKNYLSGSFLEFGNSPEWLVFCFFRPGLI